MSITYHVALLLILLACTFLTVEPGVTVVYDYPGSNSNTSFLEGMPRVDFRPGGRGGGLAGLGARVGNND